MTSDLRGDVTATERMAGPAVPRITCIVLYFVRRTLSFDGWLVTWYVWYSDVDVSVPMITLRYNGPLMLVK